MVSAHVSPASRSMIVEDAITARRLAALTWLAGTLLTCGVLMRPVTWLPSNHLGLRGFVTPELVSGRQYSQTFTMTADGLAVVTLRADHVGEGPTGDVLIELRDVTPDVTARDGLWLRGTRVPAADVVASPRYRFAFTPLISSEGRTYRLNVEPGGDDTGGVGFWATRGGGYSGGALLANGSARWADLVFGVEAPAPSRWALISRARLGGSTLSLALIVAPALTLYWALLGAVLVALTRISEGASGTDSNRMRP